ncbi:MAG TPA: 50S ribosomal protein L24 [Patescibacteria group bacterium]
MKILKNDEIKIIRGKDKGKTGKIEKVFAKTNKVLVLGVNEYKRHMKKRTQDDKSQIVTITKPLPMANVALICPKCKKETRVGFKMEKDAKVRFCKKCEKTI